MIEFNELASGLTACDVDRYAVDVTCLLTCKECNSGSNLGELTGTVERDGAGLGVASSELIDGN